jgi:hypothetical protein
MVFARLPTFAGAHASLAFGSLRGRFAALRAARRLMAFARLRLAARDLRLRYREQQAQKEAAHRGTVWGRRRAAAGP